MQAAAGAQNSELSGDVAEALFRYAKVLADQGLLASSVVKIN